uniref:Reverse transcriptase domain-containing protein n=1 Tax=Tanacetum cinerariifolium TaxID=118510 RepID=A0A6L2LZH3_TANCI|nr:reverse transcriptase domain-containing protein [Tanacetum cinerariifolium]
MYNVTLGWIINSGDNQHMTDSTKDVFNVVDISSFMLTVGHPNGKHTKITAIGSLRLTIGNVLFDVLVVPKYNDLNLGKIVGTGSESGGLYLFDIDKIGEYVNAKSNFVFICHVSSELWHSRLGHPVDQVLSILGKILGFSKKDHMSPCDICHKAKQTREPARNLFSPLDNPELTIQRRLRVDPTLLNDFEMATNRNGDDVPPAGEGDVPVPDLRTMKEFIKVNGVIDDALLLYLFPHSLTHHATAWFDLLPRNSITTFEQMAKMFLEKYFPPSMVTKLRNEITNFRQRPDESLFEAWERYKLSVDRCPNHNMLPVTKIDTFYNWLTLRHRDTINAAAGGTFMKRLTHNCETCGGPHSYNDSPATIGQTQNVYAAGAYNQGGNSYEPQRNRNLLSYRSNNYLGPPGFNQNQNRNNPNQNYQKQNRNQGNNHENAHGNNQVRNQFFQGASHGQNPPPPYQAPGYQALVHQALIPQPQVVTTTEFTNYMKANDMNTASFSGSRTIPSNIVTNPKEDLKGITTRSRIAYQGPTIPTTSSPTKVVECETEVTKDMVPPTNNESTKDVQPLPNPKPSIPYPSRLHDQKLRDKTNEQKEKFFQIFQDLNFNIIFADALILMPKFGPTIKSLLTNKEKLFELARTPLNEHCSAVLLKKLPEKLGDPGKFIIPCDFLGMDECLALADLGASINLMPLSVWNKLSLPELSPTFCEEHSQEVLGFSMSGNPTPSTKPIVSISSPSLTPFEDSNFLFEETDAFLAIDDEPISPEIDESYYDSEGDILLLEEFLNDDPSSPPLPPQELKVFVPNNEKSFINEPPVVKLKDLPPHLEYAFLEGDDKLPIIIAKDLKDEEKTTLIKRVCIDYRKLNDATRKDHFPLPFMDQMLERQAGNEYYCFLDGFSGYFQIPIDPQDQEKNTFTCPYGMFAYRRMPFGLYNAPGTFQRCMMDIFHDMIEKTMEVFMDDFSVFGNSFGTCLSHLDKMLKRCEDTNLCLNWEKSHFMVKEGIVLGHKISKIEIEVDKAKVDVIAKLTHPTSVKGAENLAADHLSRLENPHQSVLDKKVINETFPLETLNVVSFRGNLSPPWFADFANYHAGNFVVKGMSSQQKNKFFKDVKHTFGTTPSCLKSVWIKSSGGVFTARKPLIFSRLATMDPSGDITARTTSPKRLKCLKVPSKFVRFLTYETSILWGRSRLREGTKKTKRIHDSKINDRVFNVGDRVLLFNSRLKIFSCKLKTRWTGPFTITQVFPYGTVELSQTDGPNFKVNGHRLKHYFGEDIPQMVVPDLRTFLKDQ